MANPFDLWARVMERASSRRREHERHENLKRYVALMRIVKMISTP
jgi:hypothetical protein